MYNLTAINGSGFVPLVLSVDNILMFHQLGNLILISLFAICSIAFYRNTNDAKKSFATTAFIVFIAANFLRVITLVNDLTYYVCLIIFAISMFMLFLLKD